MSNDFLKRLVRGLCSVEAEGAAAEGTGGAEGGAPETVPMERFKAIEAELTAARGETKAEREARIEAEKTAATWHERAKGAVKEKAEPVAEKVDLVEAITNGDEKAVRTALKGLGFLTAEEAAAQAKKLVEESVATERSAAEINGQLYRDYPGLRSNDSEHFKETAKVFQDLEKQGIPMHLALDLAADKAAAKLGLKRGAAAHESEEERAARIGSQSGTRGNKNVGGGGTRELTPEQRSMAEKLGVDPEAYAKRLRAREDAA